MYVDRVNGGIGERFAEDILQRAAEIDLMQCRTAFEDLRRHMCAAVCHLLQCRTALECLQRTVQFGVAKRNTFQRGTAGESFHANLCLAA